MKEKNEFNPHIMFIAKPKIINEWFENLFTWLHKCEDVFDLNHLGGYDTGRIFAYLSERYLSKLYLLISSTSLLFIQYLLF